MNFIKTILRSFRKNKIFSLINIIGLTVGLTSCILIGLYIQRQLSFDKFQKNGDRIVRVIMEYSFEGSDVINKGNYTSVRVPVVLKKNFPEVEDAVIMVNTSRIINTGENLNTEKSFLYAGSSFFKIFSFKLLSGNPNTVLENPFDVVLTESTAKRYFGNQNPVGKMLRLTGSDNPYKVTGVVADCPPNSQIQFDLVASFSSLKIDPQMEDTYWNANYTTYLLLANDYSAKTLQTKLPAFMKKEMAGTHATVNFELEPFFAIHTRSPYDAMVPNVSLSDIYSLGLIALLVLAIACFTYINLSTAASIERAKEVGIRKVIGATRAQLFIQFIGESILVSLTAVIIALIISALLLPFFSNLTSQHFNIPALFSLPVLAIAMAIVFVVSLAAGSYPAFILSSFIPVKVLKGSFKNSTSGQWLRKSLIVFQFAISIFLIAATFIIQQQLNYIRTKKLGYDRSHLLVVDVPYFFNKSDQLRSQFAENPNVLGAARTQHSPVEIIGGYSMSKPGMPENAQITVTANPIDDGYIPATGLQLIAGENLTRQDMLDMAHEAERDTNTYHFILNESAAKQLGWTPEEAIGKKMFLGDNRPGFVRGVVKDFNYQSLHEAIKPVVLFSSYYGSGLLVKIGAGNIPNTLHFLETKWKTFFPDRPFNYQFADDQYNSLYAAEMRMGTLMNIFTVIAVILACLGLFGLSTYSVKQRVKEIGVRKVLGASAVKIVMMISKDFLKLTVVALLISIPLAWWGAHSWLQDFVYRIQIGAGVFFITALIIFLITLITISFQSVKAAVANPVKSLRTE
ncbi:MAG: ABC transporter permease [Chitinophagaceae bacterium]|nr:ABC transporter permease [Chitinophagaceae bacterium]